MNNRLKEKVFAASVDYKLARIHLFDPFPPWPMWWNLVCGDPGLTSIRAYELSWYLNQSGFAVLIVFQISFSTLSPSPPRSKKESHKTLGPGCSKCD